MIRVIGTTARKKVAGYPPLPGEIALLVHARSRASPGGRPNRCAPACAGRALSMPKRRAEPVTETLQRHEGTKPPFKVEREFNVDRDVLASLAWDGVETLAGDEDELYRWITEPDLWVQHVLMRDVEVRVRRRLFQLHSSLHEEMHASGFVLWRALPARLPGLTLTVRNSKTPQLPERRVQLPAVTFRQNRINPSSHFHDGWVLRSHEGPPGELQTAPAWLRNACNLIQEVTFPFVGSSMPVVDGNWVEDRFTRSDATIYALCEGGGAQGKKGVTVAAALCTPFPAERQLRAMTNAAKDAEILYIDVICAARYGAAYRLLCDIIAEKRGAQPPRPLLVVMMAVASSDVLKRYARWGFSYGGVIGGAPGEPGIFVNRLDQLSKELARFEDAMNGGGTPRTAGALGDDKDHKSTPSTK